MLKQGEGLDRCLVCGNLKGKREFFCSGACYERANYLIALAHRHSSYQQYLFFYQTTMDRDGEVLEEEGAYFGIY